jgi:hypothetical protein
VLKKAGIITGAVVAGVLALSPLAFADTTNTSSDNVGNDCSLSQAGPLVDQTLTQGESGGLVGAVNPVTGAVAPITAQTQAANCTNVVNSQKTNTNSGNTSDSSTRTRIEDSFNDTTAPAAGPFGPGFPFN